MKCYKAIESLSYSPQKKRISVRGYCMNEEGTGCEEIQVMMNRQPVKCVLEIERRQEIRKELTPRMKLEDSEVGFRITVNEVDWEQFESITVTGLVVNPAADSREQVELLSKNKSQMKDYIQKNTFIHNIDQVKYISGMISIHGWATSTAGDTVIVDIVDEAGASVSHKQFPIDRPDVINAKGLDPSQSQCGFHIHFAVDNPNAPDIKKRNYYILLHSGEGQGGGEARIRLNIGRIINRTRFEKTMLFKTYQTYRQTGLKRTLKKVWTKLASKDVRQYEKWYGKMAPNKDELNRQRSHTFVYAPKVSFVVPVYRPEPKFLGELIQSFLNQTYTGWELCLADGSGEGGKLQETVNQYGRQDARILYKDLGENLGIAGNTNAALKMATGEYIALCDHDDIIPPQTVYRLVEAFNKNRDIDVLYTDEDKIDMTSRHHFDPNFKTDFNIDLLRNVNYICHLFVIRRDILEKVSGFSSEYDGAQDYDFILRCTEEAKCIYHIPEVLYHWRCHMQSTAMEPESKMYAFDAGVRALDAHFKRVGLPAHALYRQKHFGMYQTVYEWEGEPLISVIIPNKDHSDDLNLALHSLLDTCTYKNVEVIVVENNSTEDKTWAYYEEVQRRYSNVHVVKWEGTGFNYSAINNYGVTFARGEYLLLLNNDVEFINPASLEQMLAYCRRDDVGAVGAKLFYNDHSIQHAGVIIGLGGVAGHAFYYFDGDAPGYQGRLLLAQNYSACTAACLMVKKSVYEEVGGLDPGYAVAFNDVDLCLKIRQAGYLIVYNPEVQLIHYESKSRGYEDTPEKQMRFASEIEYFQGRWHDVLEAGDPYYSPNLTLDENDFSLKNPYQM